MTKLTLEQKKKAVQIAIDGGDPRDYLQDCGSLNPDLMWGSIRAKLKQADPKMFSQLPDKIPRSDKGKKKKQAETPETPVVHTIEDAAKIVNNFFGAETPEQQKIQQKPTLVYRIRCIETDFAKYSVDDEYFTFQSLKNKNDNLEIPIEDAEVLAVQLPAALKELGVRQ